MKCISCNNTLDFIFTIKTVEDDRPIYYDYQWQECKKCGEKYYGILEENKVNVFNDDLSHKGYRVNASDWNESLAWAGQCPAPKDYNCKCAIHKNLPPAGFYGDTAW